MFVIDLSFSIDIVLGFWWDLSFSIQLFYFLAYIVLLGWLWLFSFAFCSTTFNFLIRSCSISRVLSFYLSTSSILDLSLAIISALIALISILSFSIVYLYIWLFLRFTSAFSFFLKAYIYRFAIYTAIFCFYSFKALLSSITYLLSLDSSSIMRFYYNFKRYSSLFFLLLIYISRSSRLFYLFSIIFYLSYRSVFWFLICISKYYKSLTEVFAVLYVVLFILFAYYKLCLRLFISLL